MVGILQPTVHDFVGDPACGSARMLTHVLDYVQQVQLPIPQEIKKQKKLGAEVSRRRTEAKRLRSEAETIVAAAKAKFERMILGEIPDA
jgi:type I restriction-modification system DNA methylase subunit